MDKELYKELQEKLEQFLPEPQMVSEDLVTFVYNTAHRNYRVGRGHAKRECLEQLEKSRLLTKDEVTISFLQTSIRENV